jgi:drug/metabolite transporter superfamily protein YnfA
MAMGERKEKISTRIAWWSNLVCIRNYSNTTTCKFLGVYAAYGGVFILSSIIWGAMIDKKKPDRFEIIGSFIALIGATIIFYAPR